MHPRGLALRSQQPRTARARRRAVVARRRTGPPPEPRPTVRTRWSRSRGAAVSGASKFTADKLFRHGLPCAADVHDVDGPDAGAVALTETPRQRHWFLIAD